MVIRIRMLVMAACLGLAVLSPAAGQTPTASRAPAALADLSRSLQELAETVSPSVVQLFITGYALPDGEDQSASGEPIVERSSGSGVIVDPDGYIVTNAHLVENATRIEVDLPGPRAGTSIVRRRGRTLGAQIVAVDRETDLAVLKVEARGLPALEFGDSDALRPGQLVLAFGSPLGLDLSVTMGVVSGLARQLTPEDPMIYIQTDAPINPGNSGGALVDTDGRLVGINTLIYSQSGGHEGIGFAAPSNIVRNIFTQIRKTGRVRRGELGVLPQTVTPLLAEALNLPSEAGVVLGDVIPGGPAEWAGLRPGDVVLALDGKRMENGRQFRINVYSRAVGDIVSVEIQRGDRRLTVRVPVIERGYDPTRLSDLVGQHSTVRALGVLALDLNEKIARILPPLRHDRGVVVASASAATPYSPQGRLQQGDIIYALNGKRIENVAELNGAANALAPGAAAVLQVERSGTLMYVAFRTER